MRKNLFLQTLLLLFFSGQCMQNYAIEIRNAFAGREWEFLQYEITKKMNEKRNCFTNRLKLIGSFVAPYILGGFIGNLFKKNTYTKPIDSIYIKYPSYTEDEKLYQKALEIYDKKLKQQEIKTKEYENQEEENNQLWGSIFITALLTSFVGTKICDVIINRNAAFETYVEFIKNWPKNKPFTPDSLHKSFDELYLLYQKYGSSSEQFYKKYLAIKDVISQALYNRFPPPVVIYNSAPVFYY